MGRPKTIFIDRDQLLVGIWQAVHDDLALLQAELDRLSTKMETSIYSYERSRFSQQIAHLRRAITNQEKDGWVVYNTERFSQRELTPSERLRVQQALRSMETGGLLQIEGAKATALRLTAAGLLRVEALFKRQERAARDTTRIGPIGKEGG
jgi:hypothetical protein